MIDWNELATPKEISYLEISDAIGYAYARGINPRHVLHLILKYGRGKGSTEIPPALYLEFLTALGELKEEGTLDPIPPRAAR